MIMTMAQWLTLHNRQHIQRITKYSYIVTVKLVADSELLSTLNILINQKTSFNACTHTSGVHNIVCRKI